MCGTQLASLAALLLAWLFVFDTTNKERSSLQGFREGIVGADAPAPQVCLVQCSVPARTQELAGIDLPVYAAIGPCCLLAQQQCPRLQASIRSMGKGVDRQARPA